MKVSMFMDPGLGGTGWAAFDEGEYIDSGVMHGPKTERWLAQCHSLAIMLQGLLRAHKAQRVFLEMPGLWGGSATSYASATHTAKPGEPADLFKLTYLVGVLGATSYAVTQTLPVLQSPQEWKGQLPKEVVIERIQKKLPGVVVRNHEGDAIGMGLAFWGKL